MPILFINPSSTLVMTVDREAVNQKYREDEEKQRQFGLAPCACMSPL